ncbi:MAG: PadR family transcriptional regulator [bacterium]|nr:PadR family transcriptional regulator [bacterium]
MGFLPKIEEILLLAIWKLGDNAYGITVIEQVEKDTDTTWLSGSIYGALNRLKKNGYIITSKTEQSPEQRGRPRIYYTLTQSGMDKLISAQKVTKDVWQGVPDLEKAR